MPDPELVMPGLFMVSPWGAGPVFWANAEPHINVTAAAMRVFFMSFPLNENNAATTSGAELSFRENQCVIKDILSGNLKLVVWLFVHVATARTKQHTGTSRAPCPDRGRYHVRYQPVGSRKAFEHGDFVCDPQTGADFLFGTLFRTIITQAGSVWGGARSLDDDHARIPRGSLQ
jgi:hypothetical protein